MQIIQFVKPLENSVYTCHNPYKLNTLQEWALDSVIFITINLSMGL